MPLQLIGRKRQLKRKSQYRDKYTNKQPGARRSQCYDRENMGSKQSSMKHYQRPIYNTNNTSMMEECDETDNNNTNKPRSLRPLQCRGVTAPIPIQTDTPTDGRLFKDDKFNVTSIVGIDVLKFKAWIDKKQTSLDEKSAVVLKYRTPHFRASATVELPALQHGDSIQFGWIQICLDMKFINTYGAEGITSWEFPELVSGKYSVISDADGKHYPWYGAKNEVHEIHGPCDRQIVTVDMNDNFFPQVTWSIPDPAASCDRKPRLTHVYRKQKFLTYLVLKDLKSGGLRHLRTVSWQMELNIEITPDNPLGQRAKLVEPFHQQSPRIVNKSVDIPRYALRSPNANSSQALIWRPFNKPPRMVVSPVETTINMDKYLLATADLWRRYAGLQAEH